MMGGGRRRNEMIANRKRACGVDDSKEVEEKKNESRLK
jgi:hypothetical protein